MVAFVTDYTSQRLIVLVECVCWSTGTSDFRTVEWKMSSHWIWTWTLWMLMIRIWAGKRVHHIAAAQTNFRPLSKSGGGFQDLSYVVLLLFHCSFAWQCNHSCNARLCQTLVYMKLKCREMNLIFSKEMLPFISAHIYV